MPDINLEDAATFLQTKHISAFDVEKPAVVEILGLKQEAIHNPKTHIEEMKPVLYFKDAKKGIVLNRGNTRKLIEMFGRYTKGWVGKKVRLSVTQEEHFGRKMDVVRIYLAGPATPGVRSAKKNEEGEIEVGEDHGEEVVEPEEVKV